LFFGISHVIGGENHLRSDLDCVRWGIKLYSNSNSNCTTFDRDIIQSGTERIGTYNVCYITCVYVSLFTLPPCTMVV